MKQFDFIYNILDLKGVGRVKANKVLQSFENYLVHETVEFNSFKEKLILYFTNDQIEDIYNKKIEFQLKVKSPEPIFTNRFHNRFPQSLKALESNCPPILSSIGNMNLLNTKKIGFCGSRKASHKGIEVAKDISQQVSRLGIVVVSGYASGIDIETHYWSLKEGGSTIIVLPEGINNFTIKKRLKEVWDWNRVLVISEFLPNAIWSVNRAMQRNSTIICLSDAMFLIEAKAKGGSIDAGLKCLQMHKPIFAPIYQGMPEEASGNQILISKGALPLMKKRETNRANLDKMEAYIKLNKNTSNNLFE